MSALPQDPITLSRVIPDDGDPRGLLLVWEEPKPNETYVVSLDPTVGIEAWCRELRVKDDLKTDNAALEVVRMGKGGKPAVQVAEYAGPIAPYQQAALAAHIGRRYRGNAEEGEALMIIEVWPGPGTAVIQPLVHLHGYSNFWNFKYLDQIYPSLRNVNKWPGWYSTPKSQRDLWLKANHFVSIALDGKDEEGWPCVVDYETRRRDENGIILRSPWLLDEMGDCEINPSKMRGMALLGRHDDRWQSISMNLWAMFDWTEMPVVEKEEVPIRKINWQASDISFERMMEEWSQRVDELAEA